jgi:hypothetical protein
MNYESTSFWIYINKFLHIQVNNYIKSDQFLCY